MRNLTEEISSNDYKKAQEFGHRAEIRDERRILRGGFIYEGFFYYYDGRGPKKYKAENQSTTQTEQT